MEDELKLLKYYASKIQSICQALHFPAKVRATALLYLKRAYLAFSSLDHNPKNMMLACIYLAGKVTCFARVWPWSNAWYEPREDCASQGGLRRTPSILSSWRDYEKEMCSLVDNNSELAKVCSCSSSSKGCL